MWQQRQIADVQLGNNMLLLYTVVSIDQSPGSGCKITNLYPTCILSCIVKPIYFAGHISSNAKLSHQASLKQRLKLENTETSQNVRENLQDSGRVPREPSYRRQQHAPIASVMRLLCLAVLVILAFVCLLWK